MSFFITLEGPDGGGKSTQARVLAEHLRSLGLDVLHTREPGGSPIGDQIREVLMTLKNKGMAPITEFLLFSASRSQHVHQVIRPHLDAGGIVVCDRYADSSLAYQGYGHGLDGQMLAQITRFATGGLIPDLTLLLDLPAQEGLQRRDKSGNWNRLDDYDEAFHMRVRRGFLELTKMDPERWVRIDASGSMEAMHEEIQAVALARLAAKGIAFETGQR